MEKRAETGNHEIIKIVLTGPECTGKSTLAAQLAVHYGTIYVPEYARDYVRSLNRPYGYEDVLHIARTQLDQFSEYEKDANNLIFYDTFLEITKVWFDIVYKGHPGWLDDALRQTNVHLYLVCNVDIPWVADGVRENGGEMRNELYHIYNKELEQYNARTRIISGTGENRLLSAIMAVDELLSDLAMTNPDQNE